MSVETPLRKLLFSILGSIFAVLAAGVVGDLIIKRNIDNYSEQQKGLSDAILSADTDFRMALSEIDNIVTSRRSSNLLMNEYIIHGNVGGALGYYETYMSSVDDWNAKRGALLTKIRQITECDQDSSTNKLSISQLRAVENRVRARHPRVHIPAISIGVVTCPDRPLFYTRSLRDRDIFRGGYGQQGPLRSAFEVYRYLHSRFTSLVDSSASLCVRSAEKLLEAKFIECGNPGAPSWPNWDLPPSLCVKQVVANYEPNRLCGQKFGVAGGVTQYEFAQIDFWWDLSRSLFLAHRARYIDRVCRDNLRFWTSRFGPGCSATSLLEPGPGTQ